jgi:hypothetical protein
MVATQGRFAIFHYFSEAASAGGSLFGPILGSWIGLISFDCVQVRHSGFDLL